MLSVEVRPSATFEAAVEIPSGGVFVYVDGTVSAYFHVSGKGGVCGVVTLFAPPIETGAPIVPVDGKGKRHRMHKWRAPGLLRWDLRYFHFHFQS